MVLDLGPWMTGLFFSEDFAYRFPHNQLVELRRVSAVFTIFTFSSHAFVELFPVGHALEKSVQCSF